MKNEKKGKMLIISYWRGIAESNPHCIQWVEKSTIQRFRSPNKKSAVRRKEESAKATRKDRYLLYVE